MDGAFDLNTMTVKIIPKLGVARHAGIETEILIWIGIDALAVFGSGVRMPTSADSGIALFHRLMADPFHTEGTLLSTANTHETEGRFVNGTNRRTVGIEINGGFFGITRIQRNAHTIEMEVIPKHGIILIGIHSGITKERRITERGLGSKEVGQNGL